MVTVGAAGALGLSGSASAITSIDAEAPLERKVEFLLQRDQRAQRDLNELGRRVADVEHESIERLDQLRGDMETHVATRVAASAAEYRSIRVLGAIAVVVGLGLSTAGNFVG